METVGTCQPLPCWTGGSRKELPVAIIQTQPGPQENAQVWGAHCPPSSVLSIKEAWNQKDPGPGSSWRAWPKESVQHLGRPSPAVRAWWGGGQCGGAKAAQPTWRAPSQRSGSSHVPPPLRPLWGQQGWPWAPAPGQPRTIPFFKYTFYCKTVLNFQKYSKDSIESSHISQSPLLPVSSISIILMQKYCSLKPWSFQVHLVFTTVLFLY